jgi:membrane protease YdiL (CAAX protease family)
MDNKSPQRPVNDESLQPAAPAQNPQPPLNRVSANDRQMAVGLRLAIYLFPVLFLYFVLRSVIGAFFNFSESSGAFAVLIFVQELLLFLIVFLPACMMARLENRSVGDYGLPLHSFVGKRFCQGCVIGLAEITILIGCIAAFGGYSLGSLHLHGAAIFAWAVYWAFLFLLVGLFEEFAFRGYLQFTLADGVGFWPAAFILSLGFGAVHLQNPGEGPAGAAGVATIGLIFALALKRTGNLWLVVGWHAAFDFGETFLFSVPDSGTVFEGHLTNASLHGPVWLTGGAVGPEGSIFSFLTMAAAALFIHKTFPPRREV